MIETEFLSKCNFCALPFMQNDIEVDGSARPCCKARPLVAPDGKELNIKNFTLDEIWNHPTYVEFRQSFLNNEKHPACEQCWVEPIRELQYRVEQSTRFHIGALDVTREFMKTGTVTNPTLKYLEIRPGNVCNLKCRICSYEYSSSWSKDSYLLEDVDIPYKDSNQFKQIAKCEWFDSDDIWNNVKGLEDIQFINFLGGEPLMASKHINLLEKLVNSLDPRKVKIGYNTNGSKRPTQHHIDLLKKFKNVQFTVSTDDLGKRMEYQRKGAVWTEHESNIDFLIAQGFYVVIDTAISIMNTYYCDEFFNFCDSKGWNSPPTQAHWVRSIGLDHRSLMPAEKHFVREKLKKGTHPKTKDVLADLDSADLFNATHYYGRWKKIKKLDGIRNEKFEDVFPELADIIMLTSPDIILQNPEAYK